MQKRVNPVDLVKSFQIQTSIYYLVFTCKIRLRYSRERASQSLPQISQVRTKVRKHIGDLEYVPLGRCGSYGGRSEHTCCFPQGTRVLMEAGNSTADLAQWEAKQKELQTEMTATNAAWWTAKNGNTFDTTRMLREPFPNVQHKDKGNDVPIERNSIGYPSPINSPTSSPAR